MGKWSDKPMRVLVYAPPGDFMAEPSFRLRIAALVEPLKTRGIELELRGRGKSPWARMKLAREARDFDAVVLHRKMLDPYEARVLRKSLPPGGRIFMDIDDPTMVHETQLGFLARHRLDRRFKATADIVDVVCAGNDYIAQLFSGERRRGRCVALLMPTGVDPAKYVVKVHESTTTPRLVWIGSGSTLKYLEEAMPVLGEAAKRVRDLRLKVICDAAPKGAMLPVDFVRWTLKGEAKALAAGDIGIAPTPENAWTRGKCGFKIVQYMAAGLPVVASPVGLNADLVARGESVAGLLPRSFGEWADAIVRLAGNVGLRQTMGRIGRQRVETEYSLEQVADRWVEAFRSDGAAGYDKGVGEVQMAK